METQEGGAFAVRTGKAGHAIGEIDPRRAGEYELAERIADCLRLPGRWACVEEIDAFAAGPSVLYMKPEIADAMGGQQIQQVSNRFGMPILTLPYPDGARRQSHHRERVYWPEPAEPKD